VTWLIVFLGNPGPKYAGTRHNIGFMTGDVFAEKHGARIDKMRFRPSPAFAASAGAGDADEAPDLMNLSGDAAIQAVHFYKLKPDHVIVVSDEISLPMGRMRVRPSGSAGGHNGLKSIIARTWARTNFPA
jgi:PTH1 family peptidyl-tRNA hydrolase